MKYGAAFFATSLVKMGVILGVSSQNLESQTGATKQEVRRDLLNPPTQPVVRDGKNLWVQAALLLMHPSEDLLNYVSKRSPPTGYLGSTVAEYVPYDWNWGGRVGVGYNLPHDGWDMLLNWSFLKSRGAASTSFPDPSKEAGEIVPYGFLAAVPISKATGQTNLSFDTLDFELGRSYFVGNWTIVRPFLGMRGVWADRSFNSRYEPLSSEGSLLPNIDISDYFGSGGLLLGCKNQWGFGSGWSLFGDGSFALLYGKDNTHQRQPYVTTSKTPGTLLSKRSWWTMRSMLDLALGIRWDHLASNEKMRLRLQLAWEEHLLPGFSQIQNFATISEKYGLAQGNLGIQGFSLQAAFDF